MLRIEIGLILLALIAAVVGPSVGNSWFEKWERRFSALARRRTLSFLLVGFAALGLRLAVLPVDPIPEPMVRDEFGYLLAADTFAHGRLTNPTHPMWIHFESFNILQKPTYQCITPPVQGLILAFGKIFFGHPFWGVWLSAGVMCAAITWMLQAWLGPSWALVGGVLCVLRYGVFTYWADSYWGGAAGAIGGALVVGALPRIKKSQRVRDAVLMALGLAILANNRPFDGFMFSLPIAIALLAWMVGKNRPRLKTSLRRIVLPLVALLILTAAGTGYYFWRVTGSAFRMPYQVERETYAVAPYLIWQPMRPPPEYHHSEMARMYEQDEVRGYRLARSPLGIAAKGILAWRFYLGPLLTFPFLMLVFALPPDFSYRDITSTTKLLIFIFGVVIVGCLLESFYVAAHYSSPATGVVLALALTALRRLGAWTPFKRPIGISLRRSFVLVALAAFVIRACAQPLRIQMGRSIRPSFSEVSPGGFGRASVERTLKMLPEEQLVLVRYSSDYSLPWEWVYNEADIDNAKIVWARDMGPAENQRLLQYFHNRKVWLLNITKSGTRLTPYRGE